MVRKEKTDFSISKKNFLKQFYFSLSTTKWIHLNWGDAGIKKLFQQVSRGLTKGGYFILEPQLYPSYKKKKSLTPVTTTFKNFF